MTRGTRLAAMVVVIALGFGLRVWLLADTNYNWDEGYSAWISRLPLPELFDTTARDVHPPLYYLALRAGRAVFGDAEFTLRFVSVIFGTLLVALTYRLGQAVGGPWTGIGAALLIALARSNVHISQLARMHVLAALLATGALWATVRLWTHPRDWRAALGYVLCTAGALYSFYLAVVLPLAANAAFVVVWLWRWRTGSDFGGVSRWRALWTWVGVNAAAALLFLPWAQYARSRMFGWSSDEITPPGFFTQFYAATLTVGRPTFDPTQLPYVGAYLLALLIGVVAITRMASTQAAHRDRIILLGAGILTPAVVVFLLALPFHDLGRPLAARYMTPLSASFYTLAAWGAVALGGWRRPAGALALAVPVVVAGWGMSNIAVGAVRRDDLHSIALMLDAMRRPGDAVVYHNDRTWTSFTAQYDGGYTPIPQAETITDVYAESLIEPVFDDTDTLWLIQTPVIANDPQGELVAWLGRNSTMAGEWAFNEHRLSLWTLDDTRLENAPNLAPEYEPPSTWAAPEIGLHGVERPLRRYPVGDSVNLALYWETAPEAPFELRLVPVNGGEPVTHAVEPPPPADGITRQQLGLPLIPGTPTGRYQLRLVLNGSQVNLDPVWVIQLNSAPPTDLSEIQQRTDAPFRLAGERDPLITLLGYTVTDNILAPGENLNVTLYWRAETAITTRYKVSVFLQREPGTPLVAQTDAEPVNWTLPTTLWEPGVPIADPVTVAVGADVPPWTYTLNVVLYNPATGERLVPGTPADALPLGPVTVE